MELSLNEQLQLFHAGTYINDNGDLITSGGRVLSVVAQDEDFDSAFNKAYSAIKNVHFKGINYRLDIGYQVRSSG